MPGQMQDEVPMTVDAPKIAKKKKWLTMTGMIRLPKSLSILFARLIAEILHPLINQRLVADQKLVVRGYP